LQAKLSYSKQDLAKEQGVVVDVSFTTLPTRATLGSKATATKRTDSDSDNDNDNDESVPIEADEPAEKQHFSTKLTQTERNKEMRRKLHVAAVRKHRARKAFQAQFAR
jgi:hypothetical protein